ncbi:MAG: hypothetical protein L0Z62_21045 [Gemmataceae bacterium]|nr:hypothetical protein [Gemmataceae bacterium]
MTAVFLTKVILMRTSGLLALFFVLALLFMGCSGDTKKDKTGGADSGKKTAPSKSEKPSEGS